MFSECCDKKLSICCGNVYQKSFTENVFKPFLQCVNCVVFVKMSTSLKKKRRRRISCNIFYMAHFPHYYPNISTKYTDVLLWLDPNILGMLCSWQHWYRSMFIFFRENQIITYSVERGCQSDCVEV